MEPSLRLITLYSNCEDSAPVVHNLEQAGYSVTRHCVSSIVEFRSIIGTHPFDLVIARYTPGQSMVLEALDTQRKAESDIPLIVVSKAPAGVDAVSLIRAGAYDYIEDYDFSRLAPVVCEALNDAAIRRERRYALETALQASQGKDMFLAFLSHELRNPLATITNSIHLLRSLDTAEPAVLRALDVIERATATQKRLLEDMLDISRIAVGQVELSIQPLRLDVLVTDVVQDIAFAAENKGLELLLNVQPGLTVNGDGFRLQQVLQNLVLNAVRYTPAGSIRVSTENSNGRASVSVEDTGIGIEQELLPGIFDTFTQANDSSSYSREGMGLGLALAKYLVELHGGDITASSDGPGKGSLFRFSLPLAHQHTPEPRNTTVASVEPGVPQAVKVLIVDDNNDARESLRDVLAQTGCNVLEAGNGNDALRVAVSEQPDVILMDIGLPGVDGFEVVRRLRAEIGTIGTTIVAVTGYGEEHVRTRAVEGGFDEYIIKPVDMASLMAIIAKAGRTQ